MDGKPESVTLVEPLHLPADMIEQLRREAMRFIGLALSVKSPEEVRVCL